MTFSTLWVGGPLTKIQIVSLSSFVYYNYPITLYTDDLSRDVPEGVVKKDASEILSFSNPFYTSGRYFEYADLFRYNLLRHYETMWVDADTVCLTDDLPFLSSEYVFTKETFDDMYVNGLIKAPKSSELVNKLIERSSLISAEGSLKWGSIGPLLFNEVVRELGLGDHFVHGDKMLTIDYREWHKLWSPVYLEDILMRAGSSYLLSIYAGMITYHVQNSGFNPNKMPIGSAMEYFYNKFVI